MGSSRWISPTFVVVGGPTTRLIRLVFGRSEVVSFSVSVLVRASEVSDTTIGISFDLFNS